MLEKARILASRYRSKGVLVDTDLYLLWLAGTLNKDLIGNTRRLKHFDLNAYQVLECYLSNFQRFVTTPSVITETSNLIGSGKRELTPGLTELLRRLVLISEDYQTASHEIVKDPAFLKLGFAGTACKIAASNGLLLLTDDRPLAQYCDKQRLDVVNFNHIRLERPEDLENL